MTLSPGAKASLRLLGEANGVAYTSRQVGLLLLHEGEISIDRCRNRGLRSAGGNMPQASGKAIVQYGAQEVAVGALRQLRNRGLVEKDDNRPAKYRLTAKGRKVNGDGS